MENNLKIRDIMSTELLTLCPDQDMNCAMRALLDESVSSAPVLGPDGEVLGILSMGDCLRASYAARYHDIRNGLVSNFMSIEVQTIDPELDLARATLVFLESPYHQLPVVEDSFLVGQVSRTDLLKPLAQEWFQRISNMPDTRLLYGTG